MEGIFEKEHKCSQDFSSPLNGYTISYKEGIWLMIQILDYFYYEFLSHFDLTTWLK